MNKIPLFFVFLLVPVFVSGQPDTAMSLIVVGNDGRSQSILNDDIGKITFSTDAENETYTIVFDLMDGTVKEYSTDSIMKIYFSPEGDDPVGGLPPSLGVEEGNRENTDIGKSLYLRRNYPNPFNPETKIQFELTKSGFVEIEIVDLNGRIVKALESEYKQAGIHEISWNGLNGEGKKAPSGVYLYRVIFDSQTAAKKMLLLK